MAAEYVSEIMARLPVVNKSAGTAALLTAVTRPLFEQLVTSQTVIRKANKQAKHTNMGLKHTNKVLRAIEAGQAPVQRGMVPLRATEWHTSLRPRSEPRSVNGHDHGMEHFDGQEN